jgi:AbrB family looped-hinge helix DNA binding protein
MRQESKLTAQGQITMPAEIRRQANVHPGTRFTWEVDPAGNILLRPMRLSLADVAGMYTAKHPVADQSVREAIEDGYARRRR